MQSAALHSMKAIRQQMLRMSGYGVSMAAKRKDSESLACWERPHCSPRRDTFSIREAKASRLCSRRRGLTDRRSFLRDCFGGSKATPEFQGCWSEFRPPLQYGVLANSGFISNLDSYVALILKDHPWSTDLAGGWPDLINYELCQEER